MHFIVFILINERSFYVYFRHAFKSEVYLLVESLNFILATRSRRHKKNAMNFANNIDWLGVLALVANGSAGDLLGDLLNESII